MGARHDDRESPAPERNLCLPVSRSFVVDDHSAILLVDCFHDQKAITTTAKRLQSKAHQGRSSAPWVDEPNLFAYTLKGYNMRGTTSWCDSSERLVSQGALHDPWALG